MSPVFQVLFILLLGPALLQGTEFPQLKYLNGIVRSVMQEEPVETVLILQHHLHNNCTLRQWNPRGAAVLRTTDLTTIDIRANFRRKVLAIVCIGESAHIGLLNNMAESFENMRQDRIILWTQIQPTMKMLRDVSRKATKFHFLKLIVLEVNPGGIAAFYRLNQIPSAHMDRIENIWKMNGSIFHEPMFSFQGKTAVVRHNPNMNNWLKSKYELTGVVPIYQIEDRQIIEFALAFNVTLKILEGNQSRSDKFDIQLNPRLVTKKDIHLRMEFVNPFCSSSLVVVVPCGSYMSFQDVLQQSGVQKWIFYIIVVYVLFVLIETFILKVTCRISGQASRQTINLYAFRAILGLSFPEPRRSSLSLRQLFLAIVIFGMVFSSFINCKLSAMLTKPFYRPQVTNFEELAASGLIVVTDEYVHSFIESELDTEFVQKIMPRRIVLSFIERVKIMFLLADSYAYVMIGEKWNIFDNFQRSRGERVYCTSKGLTVIDNWPRMHVLQNNSIFQWPLSRFVMFIQESGITAYWQKDIPQLLEKTFNLTVFPKAHKSALSIDQLKWLWYLLTLGYTLSILVFLGEIFWKKRRRTFGSHDLAV